MQEADCEIVKVRLPKEYIDKLRSVPQYPRLRTLHVTVERKEFVKYGTEEGVYIRNHFTHIPQTNYELIFAPRMLNGLGVPFDAKAGRAAATFPWHVEDEMLYSFNYLHLGAGKVWYAAGAKDYKKMVQAFRSLYPEENIYCENAHMHKEFFVHPDLLRRRFGVKVAKTVQRSGELICTRPYGFHAGFSLGNNAGEASNWGNKPLWFEKIAKEVREEHHYCDCTRAKPVILNHQCVDRSESRKQKKRISELERTVADLVHEHEVLKTPKAGTSSPRLSQPKKEDDYGTSVATGAPRKKPGRKPGTLNSHPHNAGGPRTKRKVDADSASTSRAGSSPGYMDYEDALE